MVAPTGTVTFLFTDVVGSTKLWDAHPGLMRAALRRHDEIIRAAVEPGRGYIFSTAGDSFAAAFWSAEEALSAAAEIHDALAIECWPPPTCLSVRAAVHTGVAEERDGDYYGPPLNRAARLMALAQPGQTLLSGRPQRWSSRSRYGRSASTGCATSPCLSRCFSWAGSPSRRWPRRSREGRPVADPQRLIGRDVLVERVVRLLDDARLVTLVGPAGSARRALHSPWRPTLAARYADGVSLVELAPVLADGDVPGAVAHALGLGGNVDRRVRTTASAVSSPARSCC